jgi:uncharacterized protein YcbK (DUF882 family)
VRAGGALKTGLGFAQPRAARRVGFAAILFMLAAPGANAAGETRTISLHNIHTHEELTITFKKNGQFDDAALKKLNAFMRDWRKEEETRMDPQLYDMLWEVHQEVKATGPIHVVCGYRSPQTNAMLRSRSSGVARTSLHMQGKAVDFSIPSANVADVRAAALRIQGGGVGYYPTSGIPFVHMDVGNVRHWPRMTRDQLAKVFPNGRTLHLSTDGPLPGYELAMADAERGGLRRSAEQAPKRGMIASLFNGFRSQQDPEETDDNTTSRQSPAPRRPAATPTTTAATTTAAATPAPAAPETAAVPLPPVRPTYQIAALTERPAPAPPPRQPRPTNLAALTPNEIIEARGYWQGLPEVPRETTGVSSISSARRAVGRQTASADPDLTASLGSFPDRVAPDVALAYAAQAEQRSAFSSPSAAPMAATALRGASAVVTQQGLASVAIKPAELAARPVKAEDRLNDPWMRGLVIAPSVQNSMVTTTFGVPDFRTLSPFMQKPASAVMMTFNGDPHLGMTYDEFTGSAVVFQATVTFGMKTAALR